MYSFHIDPLPLIRSKIRIHISQAFPIKVLDVQPDPNGVASYYSCPVGQNCTYLLQLVKGLSFSCSSE